jgi:hypothetical protein
MTLHYISKPDLHETRCFLDFSQIHPSKTASNCRSWVRQHGRRRQPTLALRQLLRMVEDYPRTAVRAAVETAAAYGLYDLVRLERMVLRHVARDFFPPEDES